MPQDTIATIVDLIAGKGERQYGLSLINQRAHALQAAHLAEQAGCDSALIVASLVHDIGHMVHDLGEDPAAQGIDDRHEDLGAAWLQERFPPSVSEPVRMHVAAKRYLCGKEPDYFARLSPDSVRSLALQGGPMSAAEIAAFEATPFHAEAVQLRRFDEGAKVKGLAVPDVEHYLPHIRSVVRAA
jgi:[1-hydroxy-2-(trimethylamino)ethyl]phosphonate dioxygenase